jgi:hypothetical protein
MKNIDFYYYFSYKKWLENLQNIVVDYKYDDNNIIIVSSKLLKKYKFDNSLYYKEYFYHPIVITHFALINYDLYLETKENKYKKLFIDQVNGLEKLSIEHKQTLVFPFPFRNDLYDLKPDWVSAMYQGEILSCFVRAYLISENEKYLELCERVYQSFWTPLGKKYGFMNEDKYGLWFEEAPQVPAPHILNGYIFAIWGIYDYYRITKREDLLKIWNSCVETLKKALPKYDLGYWSLYDLNGTIASYKYHKEVHIPQLNAMYEITNDKIFMETATIWQKYQDSKICHFRKKIKALSILSFGKKKVL